MDQEKIGKFIASCRKKQDMTQLQLAEKLGVTEKSISNWENGRNMPDVSLFKPLCNELGISINELLSGEKVKKEDYQEKFEENVIKTISYTENKIERFKKKVKMIFGGMLLVLAALLILFCIDVKKMIDNEDVLFSTWGFDYAPPVDLTEEKLEIAIEEYLINILDSETTHYENEKGFVSFKTYLIEEESKSTYNVYAWVLEEKYYLENGEVKKASGSSIPYKFVVKAEASEYTVTDSRIPRDGSLYEEDMKNIFPRGVRKDMEKIYEDGTIQRLGLEIEKQVKLYFHD